MNDSTYTWRDPKNAAGLAAALCRMAMKTYNGTRKRWLKRAIAYVERYARGKKITERHRENAMTLSNRASVRNMGGHPARNAVVHASYLIGGSDEGTSIRNLDRVVEYTFASGVPGAAIDHEMALWQVRDLAEGRCMTDDVRDAMIAACTVGHYEVAEAIIHDAVPPPPAPHRVRFGWHFDWILRIWKDTFD